MKNESTTHVRLRAFRDRIVRLEEERKALAEDIKELYAEAGSEGFDKAALRKVVKRSMMDESKRVKEQATEEIADVYLANLGLLGGAPLNDAARSRADAARAKPDAPRDDDGDREGADAHPKSSNLPQDQTDVEDVAPANHETNDEARERGMLAARSGLSVFKNPYIAGDPRRAFWDEGWCEEVGSDGMDVPEAWRRKMPPKPSETPGARG